MNPTHLASLLETLGACEEALDWAKGKSLHEVWTSCKRGDWLMWLCFKMQDKVGWPTTIEANMARSCFLETASKQLSSVSKSSFAEVPEFILLCKGMVISVTEDKDNKDTGIIRAFSSEDLLKSANSIRKLVPEPLVISKKQVNAR